ncbi:phage tail protein [Marinomonas agarivorans]|nr:phage tail protein [Marinomonas agarivorans]
MDYPNSDDLHNGKFTDGDPITGVMPSIASAEHMNTLYDELINLIRSVGVEPSYEKRDQLQHALEFYRDANNLNAGKVPLERLPDSVLFKSDLDLTGSVHWFATQAAPAGFIKANGAEVSRLDYADLFAKIGTLYGEGDGSTTFNVPDLRGEFIRGWDDGRGVDNERAFGSVQSESTGDHRHKVLGIGSTDSSAGYVSENAVIASKSDGYPSNYYSYYALADSTSTNATHGNTSNPYDSKGETRPRNIALMAYIKY